MSISYLERILISKIICQAKISKMVTFSFSDVKNYYLFSSFNICKSIIFGFGRDGLTKLFESSYFVKFNSNFVMEIFHKKKNQFID